MWLPPMMPTSHLDIVDAIESGDGPKAAEAVRDHMAGAASVLVDGAA
ncbi:hypothetical protein [Mycolicibacterium hodleri]|nr:hypothetical protein [Mycolicibacterium hodleri]